MFASEDVGVRGKDASCCTDSLFNVVVVIAVGCQPRAEVLLFVNKRDFAVGVRGVADRDTVDVDRWRQRQLSWIFLESLKVEFIVGLQVRYSSYLV